MRGKTQHQCDKVCLAKLPLGKARLIEVCKFVDNIHGHLLNPANYIRSLFCLFFTAEIRARVSDYLGTNAGLDKVYSYRCPPPPAQCNDIGLEGVQKNLAISS